MRRPHASRPIPVALKGRRRGRGHGACFAALLTLTLTLTLVWPSAEAGAQERDTLAAGPGRAEATRPDTIPVIPHEELVIRALRTPVSAAELPYAVTVRMPSIEAPSAGLSLRSQLRAVPGLQVQSRYNDAMGERIVMRGFGARAQFGIRGIHVLVDGIPATMPDGQTALGHLQLPLLERAEVLRGPAAAAYGNAAGGVLLLSTRPPPPAGRRHGMAVTAGPGDLLRLRGTTAGGHGGVGWIASVARERRDGYRPHSGTERYQGAVRFDAPFAGGFLKVVSHAVAYDADNPGALTLEQYRTAPHQAQGYNVAQRTGEEGLHGQVGATWERELRAARLEATAYGLARSLDNPIPPSFIDLERRVLGARILLRSGAGSAAVESGEIESGEVESAAVESGEIESGEVGVRWAVGLDAALQADDRQNHENANGARGGLTLDQAERVRNVGLHGQALIPLRERVGLYIGGRYDRVEFSAEDRFMAAGDPDDSGRRSMDALSPTAGLRIDLATGVQLFGNVSTAFETPTTTELVNRPDGSGGFNEALEPQRTVSYEVGARVSPTRRLRLQANAYHARITDALVPFEVASAPGRQYYRNVGAAVHEGLELLAELRTRKVDLLAAASWTHTVFSSSEGDGPPLEGNAIPGVRPWSVGLVTRARLFRGVVVEADYERTGRMAVDDANASWAPGHGLLGLRVAGTGLRLGSLRVAPHAVVDNVLDETYVTSVVPNAFGGRFFEPGPGRSLYLGLEVEVVSPGR